MGDGDGYRNDRGGGWVTGLSVGGLFAIVLGVWQISSEAVGRKEFETAQRDILRIEADLKERSLVAFRQRDFAAAERAWKAELRAITSTLDGLRKEIERLERNVERLENRVLVARRDQERGAK